MSRIKLDKLAQAVLDKWNLPNVPDYETQYGTANIADLTVRFLSGMSAWATGPIVEIGADTGLGAFALALGTMHHYPVHSFDIREDRIEYCKKLAKEFEIDNVFFHTGTCEDVGKVVKEPCLIEIDGYHLYPAVYKDIITLAPLLHSEGRFIFHDFDPRQWAGKIISNGVAHSILKFSIENPEWYGALIGGYWFLLTKSPNHYLKAWDVESALKEIETVYPEVRVEV